jgi:voltage-gated potassium channel
MARVMATRRADSASYQLFMLALCVYTLVALGAEAVLKPGVESRRVLAYTDTAICVVFLADFFVSVYRAEHRWRYLYTWGWLDLLSSIPTLGAARWGRAARVARILRMMRGVRAVKVLTGLVLEKRTQSSFLAAALLALLLLTVASVSILQVETAPSSNIKTADDAVWWALTTITTVGYGDRYPVTPEGRLVAGVVMCAGVGLFGMFSGFLAAWFVAPGARQERDEIESLRLEMRELRAALEHATSSREQATVARSTE